MSPDVRYQLNGHQLAVGHDDPSASPLNAPHSPQWQFSVAYVLPVAAKSSAYRVMFVCAPQPSILTASKPSASSAAASPR